MAGKKKDGCSSWLIGLFVKSPFGREREVERQREKQMVVENGPCSRKFLPSVEKTEHLLWSTPWIHTPDNRNEGQLQGDCVPSPPGRAS